MQTTKPATTRPTSWIEEVSASSEELIGRVKALVAEGNVRRIIIKHDGKILAEFPLSLGVVGALLAPQLAGLGAIVALVTDCTIAVEREQGSPTGEADGEPPDLPPPWA